MKRLFGKLAKGLRLTAGRTDVYALGLLERTLLAATGGDPARPPVFVLGLPRSGTTLIHQYLAHRLKVAYFTNGVERYFMSPCLVTRWQRRRHGPYRSDFESDYGRVEGAVAPHEGGKFWGRFFGFEEYRTYEEVSSGAESVIRRTAGCVEAVFGGAPFVNKNVKHLLRLDPLARIFPEAFFLVVERDPVDVALSALRGRYEQKDDPAEWWSAKPPGYEELLSLPVPDQVAHQIVRLTDRLEEDLDALGEERVMRIRYEAFCEEPERLTETVRARLGPISTRNEAVGGFTASSNRPESEEEERLIEVLRDLL